MVYKRPVEKVEVGEPTLERFDKLERQAHMFASFACEKLLEGEKGSTDRARDYAKQYAEYRNACNAILEIWRVEAEEKKKAAEQ